MWCTPLYGYLDGYGDVVSFIISHMKEDNDWISQVTWCAHGSSCSYGRTIENHTMHFIACHMTAMDVPIGSIQISLLLSYYVLRRGFLFYH